MMEKLLDILEESAQYEQEITRAYFDVEADAECVEEREFDDYAFNKENLDFNSSPCKSFPRKNNKTPRF